MAPAIEYAIRSFLIAVGIKPSKVDATTNVPLRTMCLG
jgi:hypothetical protein